MTTSPAGDKLPNVNGLRDAQPRHSLGYRVQHRARTIVASVIAAMLVFSGTAAAATWLDVNGIIKNHSVELIGQGSLDANTSIIDQIPASPSNSYSSGRIPATARKTSQSEAISTMW